MRCGPRYELRTEVKHFRKHAGVGPVEELWYDAEIAAISAGFPSCQPFSRLSTQLDVNFNSVPQNEYSPETSLPNSVTDFRRCRKCAEKQLRDVSLLPMTMWSMFIGRRTGFPQRIERLFMNKC